MSDKTRVTISVNHPKIDQYANRLHSMDRDRLLHAIDDGAQIAEFSINANHVTLAGTYGWCERCLDAPGVHDGAMVQREGEMLCDGCFDELYQDNGWPSVRVEVEPAGMVVA